MYTQQQSSDPVIGTVRLSALIPVWGQRGGNRIATLLDRSLGFLTVQTGQVGPAYHRVICVAVKLSCFLVLPVMSGCRPCRLNEFTLLESRDNNTSGSEADRLHGQNTQPMSVIKYCQIDPVWVWTANLWRANVPNRFFCHCSTRQLRWSLTGPICRRPLICYTTLMQ